MNVPVNFVERALRRVLRVCVPWATLALMGMSEDVSGSARLIIQSKSLERRRSNAQSVIALERGE